MATRLPCRAPLQEMILYCVEKGGGVPLRRSPSLFAASRATDGKVERRQLKIREVRELLQGQMGGLEIAKTLWCPRTAPISSPTGNFFHEKCRKVKNEYC